jgi:hypothetical protein
MVRVRSGKTKEKTTVVDKLNFKFFLSKNIKAVLKFLGKNDKLVFEFG